MKIITPGRKEIVDQVKKPIRFKCSICECEFEIDASEEVVRTHVGYTPKYTAGRNNLWGSVKKTLIFFASCPHCGVEVRVEDETQV